MGNTPLILITVVLIPILNCRGPSIPAQVLVDEVKNKNDSGWVNDDMYLMIADGYPSKDLKIRSDRRDSAKNDAIQNAIYTFTESIRVIKTEWCKWAKKNPGFSGKDIDYAIQHLEKVKKLGKILKSGIVIYEQYDNDDACTIKYVVQSTGLKHAIKEIITDGK